LLHSEAFKDLSVENLVQKLAQDSIFQSIFSQIQVVQSHAVLLLSDVGDELGAWNVSSQSSQTGIDWGFDK
jgi:hypothetical protein